MSQFLNRPDRGRRRLAFLATALLVCWTAIHLMAAVPELHHAVHEHSSSPQHHCVLGDFVGGICDLPVQSAAVSGSPATTPWCAWDSGSVPTFDRLTLPLAPRPPPVPLQFLSSAGS